LLELTFFSISQITTFRLMARKVPRFFLPLCFLLAGCGSGQRHPKNVFYWNIAAAFSSMDPAFASSQSNIWVVNQLFNGLVELDDSLHIVPSIARKWEISADGRIYTFHLRTDVFFHDDPSFPGGKGRKITATDFVYSFHRVIDTSVASKC
jgi:peptide/nickel transport system substrate-binding protein